jgi:hypothetical protein
MTSPLTSIGTRTLALAIVLGAAGWAMKLIMPGIPIDFALPGSKIDLAWVPVILATVWIGVIGGVIAGSIMSLAPVPTLFIIGFLWTPWTLGFTGYLAKNRGWGWKASLIFPLLHVPIGVAIFTWIIPIFRIPVWPMVMPPIFILEYVNVIVAALLARYVEKRRPDILSMIKQTRKNQPTKLWQENLLQFMSRIPAVYAPVMIFE